MGLKSIQPYAPGRVLRQFGKCQTVLREEDLSTQASEISPNGQFPEAKIRQIWNEGQLLKSDTCVRDRAKGETAPGYLAWYRRELEHERPAKRPHIRDFTESSQRHWDWLAKEKGYCAEISRLKQQVEGMRYEHNVQIATDLGERNRLIQENEMLRAQIKQIRLDADRQPRRRSDEQLIKGLKGEIREWRDGLEKSENIIAELRAQWDTRADKHRRYLNQLEGDHEKTVAKIKREMATLEIKAASQAKDFQIESRYWYDSIAQMKLEVRRLKHQHVQDVQVFKICSDKIKHLLVEKKQTRDRIKAIAHAITRRCLRCENMSSVTFLSAVMVYVKQTMHELEQLERDLTPRTAARPNNAPRKPIFKTIMHS